MKRTHTADTGSNKFTEITFDHNLNFSERIANITLKTKTKYNLLKMSRGKNTRIPQHQHHFICSIMDIILSTHLSINNPKLKKKIIANKAIRTSTLALSCTVIKELFELTSHLNLSDRRDKRGSERTESNMEH